MPSRYVNNTLELDTFLSKNIMGELHTGFVKDTGYAYVVNIPPLQTFGNVNFQMPFKAQALDRSDEALVRSMNLSDEDLKRKIIQYENGHYYINIACSRVQVKSPNDIQVHIHDDGTNLLVDLNIRKIETQSGRLTFKTFSTTIKLTEVPIYFSTKLTGYSAEDYIEGVDRGLSALGVPGGFLMETWGIENTKYTNKDRAQKYAYKLSKSLKNNQINIQTRELKNELIPKGLKVLKKTLTVGGRGLVFADMYCSGELKVSHLVSLYMLSAAFPVSWVLGGVILGVDILLEWKTNNGLGDWINYYAGKIGIGDDEGALFGGERRFLPYHRNNNELIFEPDNLRVVKPQIFDKYEYR